MYVKKNICEKDANGGPAAHSSWLWCKRCDSSTSSATCSELRGTLRQRTMQKRELKQTKYPVITRTSTHEDFNARAVVTGCSRKALLLTRRAL
jgi:hypothetical protein